MLKEQKGITLIALVITIIVLLILAGTAVTIALSGDDIFSRGNQAKTEWNEKVNEENKLNEVLHNALDTYLTTPAPTEEP